MQQQTDFIMAQTQAYWEAYQAAIVNKLIDLISKKIDLDKLIKEDNKQLLEDHNKMLEALDKMEDEDKKEIICPTVSFKDPFEKFQYAFDKLIKSGVTLLHHTDEHWNLNVKFYRVEDEFNFLLVGNYSVDLRTK